MPQPTRSPRYRAVDLPAAMAPMRALGLEPGGRTYRLAEATISARCNTYRSALCYGAAIGALLGFLRERNTKPLEAGRDDLLAYRAALTRYAPKYRANRLAIARAFYEEAIERKWIDRNPARNVKVKAPEAERPTPALTREEAETLLRAIRGEFASPRRGLIARRDYAVILLMLRLLLRLEETADLRWDDVVHIRNGRNVDFIGKGSKHSVLPIPDDVWGALQAWAAAYETASGRELRGDDPMFPSVSRAYLNRVRAEQKIELIGVAAPAIRKMVKARMADIGIEGKGWGPHALRATGASVAHEAGIQLLDLMELMRHANPATTATYVRRLEERLAGTIERTRLDLTG